MSNVLAVLKAIALSPVGPFVLAVALDDLLGIALAVKSKGFDPHKLGSFLVSQFGTKAAAVEAGLVATAVLTSLAGGSLAGVKDAAVAAALAGSIALAVGVISDAKDKVAALIK